MATFTILPARGPALLDIFLSFVPRSFSIDFSFIVVLKWEAVEGDSVMVHNQ